MPVILRPVSRYQLRFAIALVLLACFARMSFGAGKAASDPGFEFQTSNTVSSPWLVEGPDPHGIDRGLGFSHSGANNAWIYDSTTNWNAILQWISVAPNTNYTLSGWVQNNFTTNPGYFGVRQSDGTTVLQETSFNASPAYAQLTVTFNSGSNSTVRVFAGFWGQSTDRWLRRDDISLHQ